jgi:hypothetical protein
MEVIEDGLTKWAGLHRGLLQQNRRQVRRSELNPLGGPQQENSLRLKGV